MKFSLILCTINRKNELEKFLSYLSKQNYVNFELFIMDQNKDNLIDDIILSYQNKFEIRHIKLDSPGLSKARNAGLRLINGDIICFPDDDCWFEDPKFLEKVKKKFQENLNMDGLTMPVSDETGKKIMLRWPDKICTINKMNIFNTTTSISIFIRKYTIKNGIIFDEKLGVGSNAIGAGEETDFILRVLSNNFKISYFPDLSIQHPRPFEDTQYLNYQKIYNYSFALGFLLKRHSYPFYYKFHLLLRPFIGMIVYLFMPKKRVKSYHLFKGRFNGLIS